MQNTIYVIASVLGIIFFISAVQFKRKQDILLVQTFASVCYMIAYFLCGAMSGCITELIEQIKSITFYFYEKNNKKIPLIFLVIFIVGLFVIAFFTFDGKIFSLLPLAINLAYFISTYVKNPQVIRIVMLICAILWIVYNYTAGAYIFIIGNIFEIVSALSSYIRYSKKEIKNAN